MQYDYGKATTNQHGPEDPLRKPNRQTVKGWKIKFLNLGNVPGKFRVSAFYWRAILYFPSGAWWHFDLAIGNLKLCRIA